MHFLGPSVFRAAVLPPGVILYPSLSSLFSLSSAVLAWCVLAYGAGCVGWFRPLWCVRPCVGFAVGSVRACFLLFFVAPFCLFVVLFGRSSFLFSVGLYLCSLLSATLNPALRGLGFLGPLGNHTLIIQFMGMKFGTQISDCES